MKNLFKILVITLLVNGCAKEEPKPTTSPKLIGSWKLYEYKEVYQNGASMTLNREVTCVIDGFNLLTERFHDQNLNVTVESHGNIKLKGDEVIIDFRDGYLFTKSGDVEFIKDTMNIHYIENQNLIPDYDVYLKWVKQ